MAGIVESVECAITWEESTFYLPSNITFEEGDTIIDYHDGDEHIVTGLRAAVAPGHNLFYAFELLPRVAVMGISLKSSATMDTSQSCN
ncbi:PKS-ER domain-containing protein [Fusarium sp. LHS14.1]|nr:PKS-ER domain-containing protein [Fusarium sp. LHS14.1]